jgi:ankyrin repeat protein
MHRSHQLQEANCSYRCLQAWVSQAGFHCSMSCLVTSCRYLHGIRHPDCVEYLVTNGADPLICDERRHNTCLHFAALYGHSDCVNKLLASRVSFRVEQVRGERSRTQGHAGWPATFDPPW